MLKSLLVVLSLFLLMQLEQPTFYVEKIFANTKYDARYILNRALLLLPPEELKGQGDVECLVNELKASGLFQKVQARLIEAGRKNARNLEIDAIYHTNIESFVIKDISLIGYPKADKEKFLISLKRQGIFIKTPLLKYFYGELENKIATALRNSHSNTLLTDDQDLPIWVTIRPDGKNGVKLIVSSVLPKCF